MAIEIKAPAFPESVQDGTIATWHKQSGEAVRRDELIVEIETDKVVLEVVSPADGTMGDIIKNENDTVLSEEVIALVNEGQFAEKPVSPDTADNSQGSTIQAAGETTHAGAVASRRAGNSRLRALWLCAVPVFRALGGARTDEGHGRSNFGR